MSVIAGNRPEEDNYRRFDSNREDRLFCGEHTGLYSLQASEFPIKKGLFMWLENPLQIRRSAGIKRDKSGRTDSRDIALMPAAPVFYLFIMSRLRLTNLLKASPFSKPLANSAKSTIWPIVSFEFSLSLITCLTKG